MACYQDFCPHCGRIPPNLEGNFGRLAEQEKQKKRAKQNQINQLQTVFTATKKGLQLQQHNHPDQIQIVCEKNQYCNQAEVIFWYFFFSKSENAFNVQLYHFGWLFKKKKIYT